jgi:hypothetical protein
MAAIGNPRRESIAREHALLVLPSQALVLSSRPCGCARRLWYASIMDFAQKHLAAAAALAVVTTFTVGACTSGTSTSSVFDTDAGSDAAPDGPVVFMSGTPCSDNSQCANVGACFPGGTAPCGGAAPPHMCTTDGDCIPDAGADASAAADAGVLVCVMNGCGAALCIAGCTVDMECGTGMTCTAPHCVPKSCTTVNDCPANYACSGGKCGVRACKQDADCQGFCVNGVCDAQQGKCGGLPG